uniref:Condensin-2 complex subunit H2 n=1 Tax=Amazona collaria TaxID=241587 RepID=A0A8B9IYG2_9PSIT
MPPARGEVESRFVHLLQPIRDLTKNWEVDVAAQLSEYLEEVRMGGSRRPCKTLWEAAGKALSGMDSRAWSHGCPHVLFQCQHPVVFLPALSAGQGNGFNLPEGRLR